MLKKFIIIISLFIVFISPFMNNMVYASELDSIITDADKFIKRRNYRKDRWKRVTRFFRYDV